MAMDAYERVVLDQIEAGLRLDNWRPRFCRLERRPFHQRRPVAFALAAWLVATLLTIVASTALSAVVSGGLALAFATAAVAVAPALMVAAYLTVR